MYNIVNKFLLDGDRWTPEIHLKQPEFTYSACEPFNKNLKKQEETQDVYLQKWIR